MLGLRLTRLFNEWSGSNCHLIYPRELSSVQLPLTRSSQLQLFVIIRLFLNSLILLALFSTTASQEERLNFFLVLVDFFLFKVFDNNTKLWTWRDVVLLCSLNLRFYALIKIFLHSS